MKELMKSVSQGYGAPSSSESDQPTSFFLAENAKHTPSGEPHIPPNHTRVAEDSHSFFDDEKSGEPQETAAERDARVAEGSPSDFEVYTPSGGPRGIESSTHKSSHSLKKEGRRSDEGKRRGAERDVRPKARSLSEREASSCGDGLWSFRPLERTYTKAGGGDTHRLADNPAESLTTPLAPPNPLTPPNSFAALADTYASRYGFTLLYKEDVEQIRAIEAKTELCRGGGCKSLADCLICGGAKSNAGFRPIVYAKAYAGAVIPVYAMTKCRLRKGAAKAAEYERLFKASRLPSIYSGKVIGRDYRVRQGNIKALEAASAALETGGSIYIYGGRRRAGKTMLACLMGGAYVSRGAGVMFLTVPELMVALRHGAEGYAPALKAVSEAEVLILDDLGAERASEYNAEQLFMVIDRRLREGRVTIVTSGLSIAGASERYGGAGVRLRDRLLQMAREVEVE